MLAVVQHAGQIVRRAIHDVDFDRYLTVAGIIKRSSNIGAAKIALKLGSAKLYDGLRKLKFAGQPLLTPVV